MENWTAEAGCRSERRSRPEGRAAGAACQWGIGRTGILSSCVSCFRFSIPHFLLLLLLLFLAGTASAQDATSVVTAARAQIGVTLRYDPAYARIAYPNGDVPMERGVCADVLVRAFRAAGVDLQKLVHEDMVAHFSAYPHAWGLRGPDSNIDHRRVQNLEAFFTRKGVALPITAEARDYRAGDVVSWRLPNGLAHIGLVSDHPASDGSERLLMIHNIGAGAQEEDVLFAWKIVGHYRWSFSPPPDKQRA
jgi:uncharacterized protein YijF (DUF1287 family)